MVQLVVIIIVIDIFIGVYVYRDATRRGMNVVLWVIISVISVPLGLIIYMFVRKRHPHMDE